MLSGYPEPRYPSFIRPKSVEELMPKARGLVNEPPGHHWMSLRPSYNIKPGDKILFGVLSEYDPMVVEAMCRAMREKGARVDLFTIDSRPVAPPEGIGAHEAIAVDKEEDDYSYYYSMVTDLIRIKTAKALVESEKYNMVIAGPAGPIDKGISFPWHRFHFTALEDFAGPLIDFTNDLSEFISKKVWSQILSCDVFRLTDPEGTDVKWSNFDKSHYVECHLLARPFHIGRGFGGKDDGTGVVAGTINHMGVFPHCKAYIEGGQVVKVEGGGLYGDVWREKLKKYKNAKMPPFPSSVEGMPDFQISDPGFFWHMECAIGTLPGVCRTQQEGLLQNYSNAIHDRVRSGYIHNGFGTAVGWGPALRKVGLPWIHVHIHCMFGTLVATNKKGETITIIEKGHLTALDDPEVRSLASKYGDPDVLLKEMWIPAVPGINVPGDYMKDYGQNPAAWLRKEALEHPNFID